ncbi:MAG: hypothetical protein SGBAC_000358 [Bacillariaceae sp.]
MKRLRSTEQRKVSPFGKGTIYEIKQEGNPIFARGAFGELSLALRREEDQFRFVAIKTLGGALLSPSDGGEELQLSEDVMKEVSALQSLPQHDNIISLVALYSDAGQGKRSLSLVFPYYPCDLHTSLAWRRRSFLPLLPLTIVKVIAKDIFSALQHCHESGILHRDLKPGNLLVSSDGVVKLCDFGIAKVVATEDSSQPPIEPTQGQTGTKGLCTLYYRPPELLLGGSANHAGVDMYSAGVVVSEMVIGGAIFRGQNTIDQLYVIFDFLGTPTKQSWPSCESLPDFGKLSFKSKEPKDWETTFPRVTEDNELRSLLKSLVLLDPSKRLTARDAVEHAWFATFASEAATRRNLRSDLIPLGLREPILIAPRDQASVSKVGFKLASRRRTFLTSRSVSQWESGDAKNEQLSSVLSAYESKIG